MRPLCNNIYNARPKKKKNSSHLLLLEPRLLLSEEWPVNNSVR